MSPSPSEVKKKRVLIVGAGAAGMSCADTLAQHPAKFEVTVLESQNVTGGQATSIDLDKEKYGASYLNDGVQGGSHIFRHTFAFFRACGFEPKEVELQVSFGKGEHFWSNVFPSPLVKKLQRDIRRFGTALKVIKLLEVVFAFVPIWATLRLFGFSREFGETMVFPLMALFLGTGNQTAYVSSAILGRLFTDPNMRLWEYDAETLLPNLPKMFTFPHLSECYKAWVKSLTDKGVDIKLSHELLEVVERSRKGGVRVRYRRVPSASDGEGEPLVVEEVYDELIMAVLADDAKRLLGKQATRTERSVLGGAKFFDDITVTHTDAAYFNAHYETKFSEDLAAAAGSDTQKKQLAFARGDGNFKPMYYTLSYPADATRIEMSFDCTHYQPQFADARDKGIPDDRHVYQTIFLDKTHADLWTKDEIAKDKVLGEKMWHQLGHNWTHYAKVVPWLSRINSPGSGTHTQFIGSWTLVNMHEVACVSGIAAACALGAEYVRPDEFGEDFFRKYYLLGHARRYKGPVHNRKNLPDSLP